MLQAVLAVSIGAACGALLRWGMGLWLNSLFPYFALGTLVVNLLGGYLIGLVLAGFALLPEVAPEWRLLIVTGFLGSLTTFSTFSVEVITHLQQERIVLGLFTIVTHVLGCLLFTALGMMTVYTLKKMTAG